MSKSKTAKKDNQDLSASSRFSNSQESRSSRSSQEDQSDSDVNLDDLQEFEQATLRLPALTSILQKIQQKDQLKMLKRMSSSALFSFSTVSQKKKMSVKKSTSMLNKLISENNLTQFSNLKVKKKQVGSSMTLQNYQFQSFLKGQSQSSGSDMLETQSKKSISCRNLHLLQAVQHRHMPVIAQFVVIEKQNDLHKYKYLKMPGSFNGSCISEQQWEQTSEKQKESVNESVKNLLQSRIDSDSNSISNSSLNRSPVQIKEAQNEFQFKEFNVQTKQKSRKQIKKQMSLRLRQNLPPLITAQTQFQQQQPVFQYSAQKKLSRNNLDVIDEVLTPLKTSKSSNDLTPTQIDKRVNNGSIIDVLIE